MVALTMVALTLGLFYSDTGSLLLRHWVSFTLILTMVALTITQ
jgi:hypothetical protein